MSKLTELGVVTPSGGDSVSGVFLVDLGEGDGGDVASEANRAGEGDDGEVVVESLRVVLGVGDEALAADELLRDVVVDHAESDGGERPTVEKSFKIKS